MKAVSVLAITAAMVATTTHAAPAHKKRPSPPATTYTIPATGDLHKADLLGIVVDAMRQTGKRKDAFTADASSKYEGRHFVLVQRVREANGKEYEEDNSRWSYSIAEQTLHVDVTKADKFEFYYKDHTGGTYVGSNAFGVHKRIQKSDETQANIVAADRYSSDRKLNVALKLAPEAARALVADLAFVVEGDLEADSDGKVASCETSGGGNATIDDPTDVSYFTCDVTARITSMSFVKASDLSPIGDWKLAKQSARIPFTEMMHPVDPTPIKAKDVKWAKQPTQEQLLNAFPERAIRLGKSGEAVLDCTVRDHKMRSCNILSESEEAYGYGAAAINLAPYFVTADDDGGGRSYEGRRLTIPISFNTAPSK